MKKKTAKEMNDILDKKIKEIVKPWQDDINFLQSMQKLEVKDGDIVVLRHPCKLSEKTTIILKTHIEEIIKSGGFNVKVMVLEEGMDIGILSKPIKKENKNNGQKKTSCKDTKG